MDILDKSSVSDADNLNITDFLRDLPSIPDLTQQTDAVDAQPEDLEDFVNEPPGKEGEEAPEPPAPPQDPQPSEAQHPAFNTHPSPEQVCAALASSFQGAPFGGDQMISSSLMAASRRPTLSSAICSLQCRLSRLELTLPEVHSLRAFYSERSQNIEMTREQCLDIADTHGVQSVHDHYDETHFRLIDRITQRLALIEQEGHHVHHLPPFPTPTPPQQSFVPKVPPQPVVHCPPQPVQEEQSFVQCPPPHVRQEAPHSVQTSAPQQLSRLSDDSGHCSNASSASCSAESSPEPPAHKLPSPSKLLSYTKRNVIKPLNNQATQLFEEWYVQHLQHPYPTKAEVKRLASSGGVTVDQTRKWFSNKRRRDNNTRSQSQLAEVKKLQKIVSQVYPQLR